jgi:uncharacterized membrane protein YcaP (DUF421 family)
MESLIRLLSWMFGGDEPTNSLLLQQIMLRALLVYVMGLVVVRLGKSRLVSRASPFDILLGFILGSLLSRGITGHASLSGTFVATAALVAVHWTFTGLALRSHFFGSLIKGDVMPLIRDGHLLLANLRESHISEHDLEEAARMHGVESLGQVAQAFKERNGEVSIIKSQS